MTQDEIESDDSPKRGPGRPRKEGIPEAVIIEPTKRIKVTHYKIEATSVGRLLEFQFEHLPVSEADALIAKGWAVAC